MEPVVLLSKLEGEALTRSKAVPPVDLPNRDGRRTAAGHPDRRDRVVQQAPAYPCWTTIFDGDFHPSEAMR